MDSLSDCLTDSPTDNQREVAPNQEVGASASSFSRKRAKKKQKNKKKQKKNKSKQKQVSEIDISEQGV